MSIRLHLKLLLHKNESCKEKFFMYYYLTFKNSKEIDFKKMYNIYYDFKRKTRKDNETETYI